MSWEELRKEWEKYNENLSGIPILEEEQVRNMLQSKTATKLNIVILYKLVFALSFGYFAVWLMTNYTLYTDDYRYLIPFILLFLIYLGSSVFYFHRVQALYKVKKNRNTYNKEDYIKSITTLQLFEKWEWIIVLSAACPLLIVCAPIVFSKILDRPDFYDNVDSYMLIVFSIPVLISIIPGFYLYRKTCKWINQTIVR